MLLFKVLNVPETSKAVSVLKKLSTPSCVFLSMFASFYFTAISSGPEPPLVKDKGVSWVSKVWFLAKPMYKA